MISSITAATFTLTKSIKRGRTRVTTFALLLLAVLARPASAQIVQVTVDGTVSELRYPNFNSSVQVGTPIEMTFSINVATPASLDLGDEAQYNDTSPAAILSTTLVGDYSFSSAVLASAYTYATGGGINGVQLLSTFAPGGDISRAQDSVNLFSNSTSFFPNESLSSLEGLSQFSAANLNATSNEILFSVTSGPGGDTFAQGYANITSFSETMAATPEPSTWAMLLGGLGLLAFWRARRAQI